MAEKHGWGKVVKNPKDPKNWNKIRGLIYLTMTKGGDEAYKSVASKVYSYRGHRIQVTYRIVDGVARISDAWVKK